MGKSKTLTTEERLAEALVPEREQPYAVPDNWVWTRVGGILSVSSGKGLKSSEMCPEGGIPV